MTEHPIEEFIPGLTHRDRAVRVSAARLLGIDPDAGVEPFLVEALSSPAPPVRRAAAYAVGEL